MRLVPKSAAIVLHRRIESQYDVAGQSWHLATFQLRCAGEDAVALRVPEDCTITRLLAQRSYRSQASGSFSANSAAGR